MFKDRKEFEEALAKSAEAMKKELEKRCWKGYEPTPGKKPYEDDSCRPVKKDDAPHEPGSPEDSAHDVVEEGSPLEDEIKDLSPDERKDMLAHLRTLKDKRKHRSEENKRKGMDKADSKDSIKDSVEDDGGRLY